MPDLNLGDLTLRSPDFEPGGELPGSAAADGGGTSPALAWESVPPSARELVLVVHDPDAPLVDGFTHWIAAGIDPGARDLEQGATDGFTAGRNSAGTEGYTGAAPPPGHGPHHYFFHLYALDRPSGLDTSADLEAVRQAIRGHVIEQARLVGTYEDPGIAETTPASG